MFFVIFQTNKSSCACLYVLGLDRLVAWNSLHFPYTYTTTSYPSRLLLIHWLWGRVDKVGSTWSKSEPTSVAIVSDRISSTPIGTSHIRKVSRYSVHDYNYISTSLTQIDIDWCLLIFTSTLLTTLTFTFIFILTLQVTKDEDKVKVKVKVLCRVSVNTSKHLNNHVR